MGWDGGYKKQQRHVTVSGFGVGVVGGMDGDVAKINK